MRPEIRALLPVGVEGAERLQPAEAEPLFPEETVSIAKAVDKRRIEFALGRTCAREALQGLGVAPQPLLQNADRSVAWPVGFVGSITHADGYVAAVAAPLTVALGVGIDAELKTRVQDKLWKHIASEREISWFQAAENEEAARLRATSLFSAKEAFYKAQYCISRAWVGFHDVELTFDGTSFEVALCVDVPGLACQGTRYRGEQLIAGDHVVSVLFVLTGSR